MDNDITIKEVLDMLLAESGSEPDLALATEVVDRAQEDLLAMLAVAKCTNCDGSGIYVNAGGETVECQWCKDFVKKTGQAKAPR